MILYQLFSMKFPSIDEAEETKENLTKRAKKILGITKTTEINSEELKKIFRLKAKENHPDMNSGQKEATKYFKLILEAKNYLENKGKNKRLLKNDDLVEDFLGESVEELGKSYNEILKEYEEWRRNHFYDMDNESIWPKTKDS